MRLLLAALMRRYPLEKLHITIGSQLATEEVPWQTTDVRSDTSENGCPLNSTIQVVISVAVEGLSVEG